MAATKVGTVLAPSRTWRIGVGVSMLQRWPVSSIIILTVLFVAAVGAPWVAPYDPARDGALDDRHIPPMFFGGTAEHILGTDHLGRDTLTRLIYGARISMMVAAIVLVIGGGFGTLVGLVSGYFGGWVDEILMRIVDIKFSLPLILIALALAIIWGASIQLLMGLLAFLIWGSFARQVRGEALVLKETDYVKLARVAGASTTRILHKHIFPGVMNTVIVVATFQVGSVILAEASLSFLGAGIPPPTPAWGSMASAGRLYITTAWWVTLIPGLAIALTVIAFTLLGDWIRDKVDPRLRQL